MAGLFKNAARTPYRNRDALKDRFVPDEIVGREDEKAEYVSALSPVFSEDSPDNIFIDGPSGVGKTALTRHVLQELRTEDGMDHVSVVRINCQAIGGETTLMLEIANEFRDTDDKLATTGYKKARARDLMFQEMDRVGGTIIIVLDEIDSIDEHNTILYQLPRHYETGKVDEGVDVSVIGISNDPRFLDELEDDRERTLDATLIHFSEYDSNELRAVLAQRAALAFKDTRVVDAPNGGPMVKSEVVHQDVVPLVAAHATKHSGDARMAISLLRSAGDIARDTGSTEVTEAHVEMALEKYQQDQIKSKVEKLRDTAKFILYSALAAANGKREDDTPPRTREIIKRYHNAAERAGAEPVSERQVRKHLSKLDNIGLVDPRKATGGNRGMYTEWAMVYPPEQVILALGDVIERAGEFKSVKDITPTEPATGD